MIRRHITDYLLQALQDTPAVLVNGARQTGKSTLVQSPEVALPQGRQYLTFDDPGVLAAAKRDPKGFITGLTTPVTLDEIQRAPELFPSIKVVVDRRREPGRFLLTGSANVLLLPNLSESLAGRMEVLTLWPFSQGEKMGTPEGFIDTSFSAHPKWAAGKAQAVPRDKLFRTVLAGGYPPVAARDAGTRRDAWFRSYLMTILQRDVRDIANVADLTAIPQLLQLTASRVGGLLNFADLSRSLGLPQTTLKRYFALLKTTFLVELLPAWSRNLGQRVIHSPKVYLNDTGLLAHVLGLTVERLVMEAGLIGGALENFALMELKKQSAWSQTRPQLYYWRTASGQEVDIVLEDSAGRLVGIEIKASATLGANDVRGLETLARTAGKRWIRGLVLYTGDQVIPFARDLHGIPLPFLWTAD
jgi:uncharacterized protein